ncbi:YkvA family protein [Devosia naphthalenivorans]|uniref:YkvA family protein n=1 Tax=Devosia naphthalenivorans TaxID=2082392 RepID=UPI001964B123|nr:YkvA family protein [Devosia naphthalenivorans]
MKNPFSPLALLGRFTIGRFFLFRKELMTLWRAFRHPATPVALKAAMLLVPLYLISPVDLIPDFIPFLGIMDDFVIVPLLMSWLVSMLPLEVTGVRAHASANTRRNGGPTIDGRARRL